MIDGMTTDEAFSALRRGRRHDLERGFAALNTPELRAYALRAALAAGITRGMLTAIEADDIFEREFNGETRDQ